MSRFQPRTPKSSEIQGILDVYEDGILLRKIQSSLPNLPDGKFKESLSSQVEAYYARMETLDSVKQTQSRERKHFENEMASSQREISRLEKLVAEFELESSQKFSPSQVKVSGRSHWSKGFVTGVVVTVVILLFILNG